MQKGPALINSKEGLGLFLTLEKTYKTGKNVTTDHFWKNEIQSR